MLTTDIFLPGLLILLQNYSSSNLKSRLHTFLTCFLAITRHNEEAPECLRLAGQNAIPAFCTRNQLLNWFYTLVDIPERWQGAVHLLKKPKYWGRYVWSLIHGTALLVRDETDRRFFVQWIRIFPSVLPCIHCAESFGRIIKNIPTSRITANVLAMRLHEAVNHKLHKGPLTYPSGAETWRSALDRQQLLNYTPLAQIPVPVQQEETEHVPIVRHRPAPPVHCQLRPPTAAVRPYRPASQHRVHIEHQHLNCNCSRH